MQVENFKAMFEALDPDSEGQVYFFTASQNEQGPQLVHVQGPYAPASIGFSSYDSNPDASFDIIEIHNLVLDPETGAWGEIENGFDDDSLVGWLIQPIDYALAFDLGDAG